MQTEYKNPDNYGLQIAKYAARAIETTQCGSDCFVRAAITAACLTYCGVDGVRLLAGHRVIRYGEHDNAAIANSPLVAALAGGTWPWHCIVDMNGIWIDVQVGDALKAAVERLDEECGVKTTPTVWPFGDVFAVDATKQKPCMADLKAAANSAGAAYAFLPDEEQTSEVNAEYSQMRDTLLFNASLIMSGVKVMLF